MEPSIRLDAHAPAALSHAKYERPTIFGIEVSIGQHQHALVLLELQVLMQVVANLANVILLNFFANACLHNFASFQLGQVSFDMANLRVLILISIACTSHLHAREKDFEDVLHVVDEHLLEINFALHNLRIRYVALVPHLKNDDFLDVPVLAILLEVEERLWLLFILFLGNPVR